MNDSSLLVTGSSGFIGKNLVATARADGWRVVGLDVRPGPTTDIVADICDEDALDEVLASRRPSHVVHLAARTDLDHRVGVAAYAANVHGVRNLVSALSRTETVEAVVWASSRLVFEITYQPESMDDYRPTTQYGVSKVIGEVIVQDALPQLPPSLIVRPTSIWGPGCEEPYRPFFEAVLAGRYVHPRGARPRKSFGYIENTVYQILSVLRSPDFATLHGRQLMLGDYEPLRLYDWAQRIAAVGGVRRVVEVPRTILRTAATLGDAMASRGRSFPLTSFRYSNLMTDMVYDMSPMQAAVPSLPVDWEEGVERTVAWLRRR
jgi:nucleoside-diphosphate-sugar epimerase